MHAGGSSAVRLPRAQPPNARAGFVLRLLLIGGARLLHHYVQTSERLLVWNAKAQAAHDLDPPFIVPSEQKPLRSEYFGESHRQK